MLHTKVQQIRAKQEKQYNDMKRFLCAQLQRKVYFMQKNKRNYLKKFLKAEQKKTRKIKVWNNCYAVRPKPLRGCTKYEITDALNELIVELDIENRLRDVFEYPVEINWKRRYSNFDGITAPASSYIVLFVEWFLEDNEEETEGEDILLEFENQI